MARTAAASYAVVQVLGAETPHVHRDHDLTVYVLRGHGVLTLVTTTSYTDVGTRRLALARGDVVAIPRGVVHWYENAGRKPSVALACFSPPSDGTDHHPIKVDPLMGTPPP